MSLPDESTPAASTAPFEAELHRYWHKRERYVVLQAGFDAGLRLLQVWAAWQRDAHAPRRVHYLIIDPSPPTRQQLPEMLARWPALASLSSELCQVWPSRVPGYQRLFLQQGRLAVTLIVGTVAQCLPHLDAGVDLFLLPALPPDAAPWTPQLLKILGRSAMPDARLMAASPLLHMGSALEQAGFVRSGNGDEGAEATVLPARFRFAPRGHAARAPMPPRLARRAIVVGAGLAGSAACENLTARGWHVTLIEQHAAPAQEASGNLAGVFMPAISRDDNPTARLTRAAFLFAHQVWTRIGAFDPGARIGAACGVLQVARNPQQAQAFRQAAQYWQYPSDYAQWLDAETAGDRLGTATAGGWYFPSGGWWRPSLVCQAMLQACGQRLVRCFGREAVYLRRTETEWLVCDGASKPLAQAPVVILANGMQALRLAQAAGLPLHAIRGQVSHVPAASLPALPFVLCGDGYVTGACDGVVSVGASYDQHDDPALRMDSHAGNLDKLRQMLPQVDLQLDPSALAGRVGFRCVSADRLPLVGALPDTAAAFEASMQLSAMPRWSQLYGLLGYASRGLIWAPLAAEILACQLEGEPAPVGKDLLALLDPARFALKARRRAG